MPKRLSFQLYSARNHPPMSATLEILANTGYKEVEGFGGYDTLPVMAACLLTSRPCAP